MIINSHLPSLSTKTQSYIDILVEKDRFSIIESPHRSQSSGLALRTLSLIESVLRNGPRYDVTARASSSPQADPWDQLRQKAEHIHTRYFMKTRSLSWIRRFFGGVARKEQAIQTIYDRIVGLRLPPRIFSLPHEIMYHICHFLPLQDMARLAQVNKHAQGCVKFALVQRAREYGDQQRHHVDRIYSHLDPYTSAKDYLLCLFHSMKLCYPDPTTHREYLTARVWPGHHGVTARWLREAVSKLPLAVDAVFRHECQSMSRLSHVESLTAYLALGADIHQIIVGSSAALDLAMRCGNVEVVAWLLKHGVTPNRMLTYGCRPLKYAVMEHHPEMVAVLLEHGADVSAGGNAALAAALYERYHGWRRAGYTQKKNQQIIEMLLEAGADPNAPDPMLGHSLLVCAVERNHPNIVALLLKHGADVNATRRAETALCVALRQHHVDRLDKECHYQIVKMLLQAGADPNQQESGQGWRPLGYAVQYQDPEIVALLLEHGANVHALMEGQSALTWSQDTTFTEGKSLLDWAQDKALRSQDQNQKIIAVLLENHANPRCSSINAYCLSLEKMSALQCLRPQPFC